MRKASRNKRSGLPFPPILLPERQKYAPAAVEEQWQKKWEARTTEKVLTILPGCISWNFV